MLLVTEQKADKVDVDHGGGSKVLYGVDFCIELILLSAVVGLSNFCWARFPKLLGNFWGFYSHFQCPTNSKQLKALNWYTSFVYMVSAFEFLAR